MDPSIDVRAMAPELAGALLAAQRAAATAAKRGRNEAQGYPYTPMEDLLAVGRAALGEAGLVLAPLGCELIADQHAATPPPEPGPDGRAVAPAPRLTARRTWLLVHAASGKGLVLTTHAPIVVTRGRAADRAACSEQTTTLGYLLRDLLLIERPEPDHADAADDPRGTVARWAAGVHPQPGRFDGPAGAALNAARPTAAAAMVATAAQHGLDAEAVSHGADLAQAAAAQHDLDPAALTRELAGVADGDPVPQGLANALHRLAAQHGGGSGARAAWRAVGVEAGSGARPTGAQARRFIANMALVSAANPQADGPPATRKKAVKAAEKGAR